MNKWRQGSSTGYYVDDGAPSATEFKSHLVYDADNNYPLGADTVEMAGGVHYNGHPSNQTIGHWIVGKGYYNYGDGSYFADPATTVWSTVSPEFSYATSTFTNRFLQSNGVTW